MKANEVDSASDAVEQSSEFFNMVGLTNDASIAVFEGDEYLTSPIDLRPKFHLYKANIGLVTGIAWDHGSDS